MKLLFFPVAVTLQLETRIPLIHFKSILIKLEKWTEINIKNKY